MIKDYEGGKASEDACHLLKLFNFGLDLTKMTAELGEQK